METYLPLAPVEGWKKKADLPLADAWQHGIHNAMAAGTPGAIVQNKPFAQRNRQIQQLIDQGEFEWLTPSSHLRREPYGLSYDYGRAAQDLRAAGIDIQTDEEIQQQLLEEKKVIDEYTAKLEDSFTWKHKLSSLAGTFLGSNVGLVESPTAMLGLNVGKSWSYLKALKATAISEAAIGMGTEALIQHVNSNTVLYDKTAGEIIQDIAIAGAAGGILGAAFRALDLGRLSRDLDDLANDRVFKKLAAEDPEVANHLRNVTDLADAYRHIKDTVGDDADAATVTRALLNHQLKQEVKTGAPELEIKAEDLSPEQVEQRVNKILAEGSETDYDFEITDPETGKTEVVSSKTYIEELQEEQRVLTDFQKCMIGTPDGSN